MTSTAQPGPEQSGNRRQVTVHRLATGQYRASNAAGASLDFGGEGKLSPVELLMAAVGGCTAIDVDVVTARRAQADKFDVVVGADRVTDEGGGHRLDDVGVDFQLHFSGAGAEEADGLLRRLIKLSHDRDCTVSRTVEHPTKLTMYLDGDQVTG